MNKDTDYDAYWGDLAKPVQARLQPRASISVPLRFYRGPLARLIQAQGQDATRAEIKAFLEDALKAWYTRYKDRQTRAEPDWIKQLRVLVPTPGKGEASTRLDVNLQGQVRPEAFGRVLETRFSATRQGAGMALREAILEALASLQGDALGRDETDDRDQ